MSSFLTFPFAFKRGIYKKKEGVGNFLLWMQEELFHCQHAENLLKRQYFWLSAARVCLVSYKKDYIHYKISWWHFQKQMVYDLEKKRTGLKTTLTTTKFETLS